MESVLGVRIPIPAEAVVPLLIGVVALLILVFAGSALADWKAKSPGAASKFGLGVGAILTVCALYFLFRCLTNQVDPNNEGGGNINFTDAPTAGGMLALAAAFWRMGGQRYIALGVGIGFGALMMAKPFIWPVITTYSSPHTSWSHPRDMLDPEHLMFLGPGLLAIFVGMYAGLKRPS